MEKTKINKIIKDDERKNPLIRGIFYLFIFFIIFFEYSNWNANSYSFLWTHDAYTQTFPWMARIIEDWKNFDIPFWTFGTGLGTSLIGELQPGVLYPITILASIFSTDIFNTTNLLIFFHAFIAATGVFSCGLKLKTNIFLCLFLSIGWAYFLLESRAFGQANLYYGYCYISWISSIFIDIYFKSKDKKKNFFIPYPIINNSINLAVLVSLSVLAGHTYATIGILFFWLIFGILGFLKGKEFFINKKNILKNWFIFFITFLGLTIGQLLATSEYFKISRKWYGAGSTLYPHVVPSHVIADAGVTFKQIIYTYILGKNFSEAATESVVMPGVNLIFLVSFILLLIINLISYNQKDKLNSINKNKSFINSNIENYIARSNLFFFTSIFILFLSMLPTLKPLGINLLGALLYKLIPILNSVRLPGRLLIVADFGLLLSFMSYLSILKYLYRFKFKPIFGFLSLTIIIIFLNNQFVLSSRDLLIAIGGIGKESIHNPKKLLNSECNKFFNGIYKDHHGLVNLYIDNDPSSSSLPKNLGDLPGYPRFIMNNFRSSLTRYQMSTDKKGLSTLNRINNKNLDQTNNKLSCKYNDETFYFDSTLEKANKFNSFIYFPEVDNLDEDKISEKMQIKNHIINFVYPLFIKKEKYEIIDQRPFVKLPFYPGWKVKTIDGKEYSAINQNNFLGFPKEVYGNQIIQIKYAPKWLYLVYFQIFSWMIITIYFFNRFIKWLIKWK